LPSVAATLVAVTAPWKSETEVSVILVLVHDEPLTLEAAKATTEAELG
jgi:hypothetical protein